jgi:hypothetical protein
MNDKAVSLYRYVAILAVILAIAGSSKTLGRRLPDPHQVPVMDGEAGPCSVTFTRDG